MQTLFPETRWSLVVKAQEGTGTRARRALNELCQSYWYPLYAFLRGMGLSQHDAEDRTQSFIASIIERRALDSVSPDRGKLRAYFKAALRNFNHSELRRDYAQKRGGGDSPDSLEQDWEGKPPVADSTSDLWESFDRHWAFTLLKRVFSRLEAYYERKEKRDLYEAIRPSLEGDGKYEGGDEVAKQLNLSPEGLRSAVYQLRRRFGDYVREEIADTCVSPEDVREELAYLCRMLTLREPNDP